MTAYVPPKFSFADVFKSSKKIRDEMAADAFMHKIINEAKLKQAALDNETESRQEKQKEPEPVREKHQEKDKKKSSPTPEPKTTKETKGKSSSSKIHSNSSTAPPSPHKHKKQRRKSPSPQPEPSRSASMTRTPSDAASTSSQAHAAMFNHPIFHPPITPWGYPYMAAPEYNAGMQYPVQYAGSGVYHPAQSQPQSQPEQPASASVVPTVPASIAQEIPSAQPVQSSELIRSEPTTVQHEASEATPAPVPTPHAWTTEQDTCLIELKKKGCTWNSISRTLNIPRQDCRSRWAEIKPAKEQKSDSKIEKHEDTKEEKKEKKEEQKDKKPADDKEECQCKNCKEVENKNKDGPSKEPSPEMKKDDEGESSKPKKSENKRNVTFSEPLILKSAMKKTNETFDLQEILLLHQLAERFEREKWLRVSSRFFDLTGRRITPLDAKGNVAVEL